VAIDGDRLCFSDACARLGVKRNIAGMRATYHGLTPQQAIDFYISARATRVAPVAKFEGYDPEGLARYSNVVLG
jgi:hypothetical protein